MNIIRMFMFKLVLSQTQAMSLCVLGRGINVTTRSVNFLKYPRRETNY